MRHVFATMGTIASVDLTAEHSDLLPAVEAVFGAFDARFSLYRPESELSRIADGTLRLTGASDELVATYARALEWRNRTDGNFSPERPDGVLDLNGIVKAEAIERAGALLDTAGCQDWTINVGGDILTRSDDPIGISDPGRSTLLCAVTLRDGRRAVATSGSAERGDHIWRGGSLTPPHFVQVTVIADDIVTADVLATAIVAGGPDALDGVTARWPVDVLTVDRDGQLLATPGIRASLATAGLA
jgi:thiamine biosynthesis lipoprotein